MQNTYATKNLLTAAETGQVAAQYKIGLAYAKGDNIEQSDIEAYAWWNTAAEQGHPEAADLRDKIATFMSEQELTEAKNSRANAGRNTSSNKD